MLSNGTIDENLVLSLLSQGLGTRAIAAKLNCSRKTIRYFVSKKGIKGTSKYQPSTTRQQKRIKDSDSIFYNKINKDNQKGCWIWRGPNDGDGYGIVNYNKQKIKTHRLFYMLFKGEIPKNMVVCHKCDVKLCCNPDHLFLGTDSDNIIDCIMKQNHSNCKLNEYDVREIRLLHSKGESQKDLSLKYNVTQATINSIIIRKTWWYIN